MLSMSLTIIIEISFYYRNLCLFFQRKSNFLEKDCEESAKAINSLVAHFTRDNLKNIIEPASLDELIRIVLARFFYFKAQCVVNICGANNMNSMKNFR